MTNKQLPAEAQERIEVDAQTYTNSQTWRDKTYCMRDYIAGATAENTRAQVLVDALEAFIVWQGSTLKNWPVMKQAHEALQQWKGKGIIPVKASNEAIFEVKRISNNSGISNLTIIIDEAIPDVYIGSILLVPFVLGYRDPIKVKVKVDETGKPIATNIRTCIVTEYIY